MKKQLTEEEKHLKKLRKLRTYYNDAATEIPSLTATNDRIEQVQILVDAACTVQTEIDQINKYVKEEAFETASDEAPLDKATWNEMVKIVSLKSEGKLKDKQVEKFQDDVDKRFDIATLRKAFLESYINTDESAEMVHLSTMSKDNTNGFAAYTSEEFMKVLDDASSKYIYLNFFLKQRQKNYLKAAQYVTELEMTPGTFSMLVQMQYTKDGNIPEEGKPSKLWSAYKRFDDVVRAMNKYGYQRHTTQMGHEFGLEVTIGNAVKTDHSWDTDTLDDDE